MMIISWSYLGQCIQEQEVHPSLNSHILFYSSGLPNLAQYAMYIRDIKVNDDHESAIVF